MESSWIHTLIKLESHAHRIVKNADKLFLFLYPEG